MKKSTIKKPTKQTSSKTLPVHHLKPIDELLDTMQNCEHKLKNLLESIPAKLEKLVATVKSKLAKTVEQHKKASLTLKTTQAKHKTKPSKLTASKMSASKMSASKMSESAIKKSEHVLAGHAAMVTSTKEELAALQTQLAICKDMKKILNTSGKSPVKKTVAKKPALKRAKKVVLDSPDVIAAEHF